MKNLFGYTRLFKWWLTAGGVVSAPLHNQPNQIQLILAHLLHRLLATGRLNQKNVMDFNKLRQKKIENWTVKVVLDNFDETMEIEYVPIPNGTISPQKQAEIINEYLNQKYGKMKWLAYNVD